MIASTNLTNALVTRSIPFTRLSAHSPNRQSSSTPSLITITIDAPQSFDPRNRGFHNYKTETVQIPSEHGPALRSALEELKNTIGSKLEAQSDFRVEASLTRAANAVAKLFSLVCRTIPSADADYNLLSR